MTLTRKDLFATVLTVLVVLVFATAHEGWGVPLLGDSHRWAAGAILLLGIATCGQGSADKGIASKVLALLGMTAFAVGVAALVTGSLTPLSLLVVDTVVLWAASTLRHAWHHQGRPVVS
ncbi:MAG TPA: hypothetical protein VGF23_05050 [Gaiellaceae bacterium]